MNLINKETNTCPSVIHANGNSKKQDITIWDTLVSSFRNTNPIPNKLDQSLSIITLKGGRYKNDKTILEETCEKYGIALKILPWPDNNNFWEASKAKNYELLNAIDKGDITTKYIMPLDCTDVILLKHPNDILSDYLRIFPNTGSVWNGETNDWPRFNLPKYVHHPILDSYLKKVSDRDVEISRTSKSKFVFLNSGASIGLTDKLRTFYKTSLDLYARVKTNDQAMARTSQYILSEEHTIDIHCKIFQCLYGTNKGQFEVNHE